MPLHFLSSSQEKKSVTNLRMFEVFNQVFLIQLHNMRTILMCLKRYAILPHSIEEIHTMLALLSR